MNQYSIFVGGPIQYAVTREGTFHSFTRSKIECALLALEDYGYSVLSAHRHENYGEMDVSGQFQQVCRRDFHWMQSCDLFVAVLPLDGRGQVIHTAGTSVELGWASAMGKPIVLVCDPSLVYSHLVIGLDAVAKVVKVDINRDDLGPVLCDTVADLLMDGQRDPAELRSSRELDVFVLST